jgi:NAD(P)H-dependent nitrite reductase small subunit
MSSRVAWLGMAARPFYQRYARAVLGRLGKGGFAAACAIFTLAAAPAGARVVDFPLQLDHAFVRQRMVETLFDGEGETTRVWRDASRCNDVMLAHPRLSARDGKLHVVADFDAKLGAPVGNWCVNATRRKGILDAALEARLHPTVPIVEFRVVESELLDADGKKRFTGALWDWVRAQVHPHLETMRIDLYQPVTELKTFLPVLFPGSDFARVKKLIDSLALSDVVVSEPGISLRVRLDVPDPQVSRSPQDREAVAQRGEAERSVGPREEGKASEDQKAGSEPDPALEPRWVQLARASDFPRDGGRTVKYGAVQLAVFHFASRGEWYATQAQCPHRKDMVLGRGLLGSQAGEPKVACPLHKKTFSLATGKGLSDSQYAIRTFPVEVRGSDVYALLPPEDALAGQEISTCAVS